MSGHCAYHVIIIQAQFYSMTKHHSIQKSSLHIQKFCYRLLLAGRASLHQYIGVLFEISKNEYFNFVVCLFMSYIKYINGLGAPRIVFVILFEIQFK